jgi:transcriptional regulator with XRE-family HTH domain
MADSFPNPIDVHVGKRLRLRRNILKITQKELAEMLGLTFQQVQKYEKGDNRISASRLWDISQILGVPIDFFFEDIDEQIALKSPRPKNKDQDYLAEIIDDPMQREETLQLVRAYYKIHNRDLAKDLFNILQTLSKSTYQQS